MEPKSLPIGIQTFRTLIEGNFLYVDKTRYIYELIRNPKGTYFLARPRRFGKSLLLSTLAELFMGNKALFQGLWIHEVPYQWDTHPILRLDFSRHRVKTASQLEEILHWTLTRLAQQYRLKLTGTLHTQQFEDLIFQLAQQQNHVVILIDEYDKPILDNIDNLPEAKQIQDILKGFYTVIKSMDAYIRFVFLTGISKFSKVGVFSGLNNLNDISLDERYAAMLGITQNELETAFQDRLPTLASRENITQPRLLAQIRFWYNGFCFSRQCQPVYNPFSLLLLFDKQQFQNFWFATGTPTFLLQLIQEQAYDLRQLESLSLTELGFNSYEIERLKIVPLLFQTGYLTIKSYDARRRLYQLSYPNFEVENAFSQYLLEGFSDIEQGSTGSYLWQLIDALQTNDLHTFFNTLNIFLANIPYDIQIKREKYYQTIFYLVFKLLGFEIEAEARTSRGRIDAVIVLQKRIFLFEFKLDGQVDKALTQIRERDYFIRYQGMGKPISLVGVNFHPQTNQPIDWVTDTV